MPLYSCEVVGTGTEADPIRPPFSGSGIGWINLAPPGSSVGRGLLYLPVDTVDARIRKIADDVTERTTLGVRTTWQNELGITLARPSTVSWAELVSEILREHGRSNGTRWGILQQSRARSRFEIYLGALGLIWSTPGVRLPSTQSFSESWPTNSSTLSTGQDQAWTEIAGNLEVVSGGLRGVTTAGGEARCESDLDTEDQYHSADFALVDGVTLSSFFRLAVRAGDASNYYFLQANRNASGHQRFGLKRVAGANTTIVANDANDPGASGLAKVTIDGSTMTVNVGAYEATGTDGTPQLTANRNGYVSFFPQSGTANVILDNHTIADVVSGGGGAEFPSLLHLGHPLHPAMLTADALLAAVLWRQRRMDRKGRR